MTPLAYGILQAATAVLTILLVAGVATGQQHQSVFATSVIIFIGAYTLYANEDKIAP